MTPERFRSLLDAYGADLRRWPEAERDAAHAVAGDRAELRAAVAEAAMLDRELDCHEIAAPAAALIDRIVAAAASSSADAPSRPWWRTNPFWPGAGWALTGLAGALAGALLVSVALGDSSPAAAADWQKRGTAFNERAVDWSEE